MTDEEVVEEEGDECQWSAAVEWKHLMTWL